MCERNSSSIGKSSLYQFHSLSLQMWFKCVGCFPFFLCCSSSNVLVVVNSLLRKVWLCFSALLYLFSYLHFSYYISLFSVLRETLFRREPSALLNLHRAAIFGKFHLPRSCSCGGTVKHVELVYKFSSTPPFSSMAV